MESATHSRAEISARRDLSPDLWTLKLRVDPPLSFQPGQFATLGVADGQKMIERPYSIVSSPKETELEFFLEHVPHGRLSARLHRLGPGDPLWVRRKAKGNFRFDRESGHRAHLMVATVTGVAPFVSMARNLRLEEKEIEAPVSYRIFLLHGASRSWELGFDRELANLEREVNWFRYLPVVSRPWEDAAWAGERGRLPGLLPKYLELFGCDITDTTVYLCGNPLMIEAAKNILTGIGYPLTAVREERYWVAT
jgi:ferredoxin/flavodoxin---NADP+ reductase